MHPGFFGWWKHAHASHHGHHHGECGAQGYHGGRHGCGPGGSGHDREAGARRGPGFGGFAERGFGDPSGGPPRGDDFGAGLGVRRPLRFLAHKLELEEAQVETLATILDRLKTERAQAEVDNRRRTGNIADAMAGATLDTALLAAAGEDQVKSAERLKDAVARALSEIHALLDDEQRRKLAYLLRTGMLTI